MPKKKAKVCPKCGSKSITPVLGTITGQLYKCPNCGYYGPFIIEANEEMIERIKDDYEKNSKE